MCKIRVSYLVLYTTQICTNNSTSRTKIFVLVAQLDMYKYLIFCINFIIRWFQFIQKLRRENFDDKILTTFVSCKKQAETLWKVAVENIGFDSLKTFASINLNPQNQQKIINYWRREVGRLMFHWKRKTREK